MKETEVPSFTLVVSSRAVRNSCTMDVPECGRKARRNMPQYTSDIIRSGVTSKVIYFLLHSGTSIMPLSLTARELTTNVKDGTAFPHLTHPDRDFPSIFGVFLNSMPSLT
ncbi:unnamed protein product [Lepeophtheirus salmonis]|uniref:(salmon louse) hypothetical protein n=1 Tax=Lepeophtheirus salmonis TaxID=72036 RepID=A0A7R8H484_LEPSM|nr:unnamed protein product [Lepeophtheirus salmonis]CAF2845879.1 unnamed protein product [Lepeophtheirus salmonis]